MGNRTEYYREYYWNNVEEQRAYKRAQMRRLRRLWGGYRKCGHVRKFPRNPWLAQTGLSYASPEYKRQWRFEHRLWAALDLKLDEENLWNASNGLDTGFWPWFCCAHSQG